MQRPHFLSCILMQVLCAPWACALQGGSTPQTARQPATCRIWTEAQDFTPRKPAILHVSIENHTAQDVVIKGIEVRLSPKEDSAPGTLRGGQRSYQSWIDPETKLPLKMTLNSKGELSYPEKKFTLHATKKVEFTLDLAKLEWTDELSSVAPSTGTFYGIVRGGTYEIAVELNGRDNTGHLKIESNKPKISIRPASK